MGAAVAAAGAAVGTAFVAVGGVARGGWAVGGGAPVPEALLIEDELDTGASAWEGGVAMVEVAGVLVFDSRSARLVELTCFTTGSSGVVGVPGVLLVASPFFFFSFFSFFASFAEGAGVEEEAEGFAPSAEPCSSSFFFRSAGRIGVSGKASSPSGTMQS